MKNLAKTLVLILIFMISTVTVFADTMEDDTFHSTYTNLSSSKVVTFYARTKTIQSKIYVSSCHLYKKNGNDWVWNRSLPAPSESATNATTFGTTKDYSSYIGSGTYRIYVTYRTTNDSISKYTNIQTY